tara:strand:+ start:1000 stop:1197 length:198 start_codon:yes stop_codon:yes gene_type:complete
MKQAQPFAWEDYAEAKEDGNAECLLIVDGETARDMPSGAPYKEWCFLYTIIPFSPFIISFRTKKL